MRRLTVAAVAAALPLAVTACGSGPAAGVGRATGPAGHRSTPTTSGSSRPGAPAVLRARTATARLPAPLARPVVLPDKANLTVLGGLDAADQSTARVLGFDPNTGTVTVRGHLARATHDAAGAVLGGRDVVFGGGTVASTPTVQDWRAGPGGTVIGHLPTPRSDLSAVTVGGTAYLVGGYTGSRWSPTVLATRDGTRFRVVAHLPVPVRYAAVAASAGRIVVAGGVNRDGKDVRAVQEVNLATGRAAVVGRLPRPLAYAAALALGGRVYVAGGQDGAAVTDRVWAVTVATGRVTVAGRLPTPVADAGAATIGATGYLIGGTNGTTTLTTVITLRVR